MNSNMAKTCVFFKEKNIHFRVVDDNCIDLIANLEQIKNVRFLFVFREVKEGLLQNVQIQVPELCVFPPEKKNRMYKVCSILNKDYCGITFRVSENLSAIVVDLNVVATSEKIGSDVYNRLGAMVHCINEVYPKIMKGILSL